MIGEAETRSEISVSLKDPHVPDDLISGQALRLAAMFQRSQDELREHSSMTAEQENLRMLAQVTSVSEELAMEAVRTTTSNRKSSEPLHHHNLGT